MLSAPASARKADGIMRGRAFLNLSLVGLIAALGLANMKLAEMPIDVSPIAVDNAGNPSAPSASTGIGSTDTPGPLADFRETIERPLFNPARRPMTPKPPAPEPEVAEPLAPPQKAAASASRLSLAGLISTGKLGGRALLRPEGATEGTWVEVGGEFEGWRVARIDPDGVVLEGRGGEEVLRLHTPRTDSAQ
jgi:hypothetical protein